MLKLSDEEFRKVQLAELELLKEVDRICSKHNIRYCIIAGTLLGAVRHGGFIPWDDDADVALLRGDYEKFRKACKTELKGRPFYFQDDRNTVGYRWGYGKLRIKDSVFRREHQEDMPYPQGICIDVFPMDGVPDFLPARVWKDLECFCVRKLLWSKTGAGTEKNPVKKQIYKIMRRMPEKKAKGIYHDLIRRAGKRTKYVRILMFPTGNQTRGYKRSWYARTADIRFEGVTFRGIADFRGYLEFKFGDYMKYPPLEDRVKKQHPVTALKFPGEELRMEETDYDRNGGSIKMI